MGSEHIEETISKAIVYFFCFLAAYTCSFPAMPTIHTRIRALVLQAFLGAALESQITLLFELSQWIKSSEDWTTEQ